MVLIYNYWMILLVLRKRKKAYVIFYVSEGPWCCRRDLTGAWSEEIKTNLLLPWLQSNVIHSWIFFRPLLLLSIEQPLLTEHQLAAHEPSVECPDLLEVMGDVDEGEDEGADKGEAKDDQDYLNLLRIHL